MNIELLSCSVIYFGNFCKVLLQPTAAAPRRAAAATARCCERIPGDSRAIQRIRGIRAYPQIAHDRGSSISGSEAAHTATTERNLRINACTRLCDSSTVAQPHLRSPLLPRDKPAVQAPAIGAPGTQRRRRSNKETCRYPMGPQA